MLKLRTNNRLQLKNPRKTKLEKPLQRPRQTPKKLLPTRKLLLQTQPRLKTKSPKNKKIKTLTQRPLLAKINLVLLTVRRPNQPSKSLRLSHHSLRSPKK